MLILRMVQQQATVARTTQNNPWKTLEEVVSSNLIETQAWSVRPYDSGNANLKISNPGAPIKAGDTILLANGNHGKLEIFSAYNTSNITIKAMQGATPKLTHIRLLGVSNWVLDGLTVSPSFGTSDRRAIVDINSHAFHGPSFDVILQNSTIFTVDDNKVWKTKREWFDQVKDGIESNGDNIVLQKNTLRNIRFGIAMSGQNAHVLENSVRNFSGDGIRGLGDHGKFENNYIANCYKVDTHLPEDKRNHEDGFQSWSIGKDGTIGAGERKGIIFRGNTILNREDSNQRFAGPLQGLGCFDGFYTDWVVENNVIMVDHWHGITLLGAKNSRIINNTVLDINNKEPGPAWIMIGPHKNKQSGTNNIIRNNLAQKIEVRGTGTIEDHNLLIADPSLFFVSSTWPWDLHLIAGAPAIDAGSSDLAPAVDREGNLRTSGAAIDIGAYEWFAKPPTKTDMGKDMNMEADMGNPFRPDSGQIKKDMSVVKRDMSLPKDTNASQEEDLVDSEVGCACNSSASPFRDFSFVLFFAFILFIRNFRSRATRFI